jgi:hypothetical protein
MLDYYLPYATILLYPNMGEIVYPDKRNALGQKHLCICVTNIRLSGVVLIVIIPVHNMLS